MHDYLIQITLYLAAAVIAVPLFKRFGMGAILAYLFAGIIVGPQVLKLIDDPKAILQLSELGVVFLLFIIGLELQPTRLWQMRRDVFGLGLAQVLVTGVLFWAIAHYALGLIWSSAFVAGFGLALSSTAFGIQLLEENRQLYTTHGQGSFAILLFQDLAVVPLIALIPLLSAREMSFSFNVQDIIKVVGILALFVLSGLFLIRHLFRLIAETRVAEVFTAASLLIVVGSALLMEVIGLSMGMGAFLAGVLLANSEYRHELEVNLEPFKGLLLGLFFIAVGMSLDLDVVVSQPLQIAGIVAGIMVLKGLIIYGLANLYRYPRVSSRTIAFTLPQGGEFAFVIFAAAISGGVLERQIGDVLNAAVTMSMLLTPFGFKFNSWLLQNKTVSEERRDEAIEPEGSKVIVAGFGRFGQIVTRFLRIEKVSFTILEHSAAQVDIARKYGAKVYYGDASRKDVIEAAGGKDARLFILAIDDPEVSVTTAKMVCEQFPHLHVIARARNRGHAIELINLGIENVHRETYLTSLEVAKEVLLDLAIPRPYINKRLAKFRQHDEKILRQQAEIGDDEKKFVSFTTQANAELDQLLQADAEGDLESGTESVATI